MPRCGGIGRHAGLKIPVDSNVRAGSTPASGTKISSLTYSRGSKT